MTTAKRRRPFGGFVAAAMTAAGCADLLGIVDLEEARPADAGADGPGRDAAQSSSDARVDDRSIDDALVDAVPAGDVVREAEATAPPTDARAEGPDVADASTDAPDSSAGEASSPPIVDAASEADASVAGCASVHRGLVLWLPGDSSTENRVAGMPAAESWNTPEYAVGRVGFAPHFSNATDGGFTPAAFWRVPTYPELSTPVALTVQAWVRADAWGGTLLERTPPASNDGWRLGTDRGAVSFCVGDFCALGALPARHVWVHLAATYSAEAAEVRLFVDGEPVSTATEGTLPTSVPDLDNEVRIGASAMGDSLFAGSVDEASVWARALSGTEIRRLFQAGDLGLCRDCVPLVEPILSFWTGDGIYANAVAATPPLPDLTPGAGVTFATGRVGQAMDLGGGSSAFLEAPGDPRISPDRADAFTVVAWVKRKPGAAWAGRFVDKVTPAGNAGWSLGVQSGLLGFAVGGRVVQVPPPSSDAFVHLASRYSPDVFDEPELALFVDATPTVAATSPLLAEIDDPARPIRVGADGNGALRFSGSVDELMIVGRALGNEEVTDLLAAGSDGVCRSGGPMPSLAQPGDGGPGAETIDFTFSPSVSARPGSPEQLEVFAVGTDARIHRKQRSSGVWSGWRLVRSDASITGPVDSASWDGARMDVVAPGTISPGLEGHATHTWLIGSNFAPWADETGQAVTSVAFASPRTNELWQFGVIDGGPNSGRIGWRRFASMLWGSFAYTPEIPASFVDAAAFTAQSPASVSAWVVYLDPAVPPQVHAARFVAPDGSAPAQMATLDLPMRGAGFREGACVAMSSAARVDVFSVGADDGALYRARTLDAGASWVDWGGGSRWESLGGQLVSKPDCTAIGTTKLFVVARLSSGAIGARELDGAGWGAWREL